MPAAAVVARIQPAATGALPIHCDVPSNLRYPSCPRFTIGSSGSAAKSRPLKTGCRPSSTGDRLVRAEPDPARHRRTAPTSRPPTRADSRDRPAGAATRPRSGPRPGLRVPARDEHALGEVLVTGAAVGGGQSVVMSRCVVDRPLFDPTQPHLAVNHTGVIQQCVVETVDRYSTSGIPQGTRNRRTFPPRLGQLRRVASTNCTHLLTSARRMRTPPVAVTPPDHRPPRRPAPPVIIGGPCLPPHRAPGRNRHRGARTH
jgi:hypothetical protein